MVVESLMLLTVELFERNVAVGSDLFKFTEQVADCVEPFCRCGNLFFRNKVLLISINKCFVCFAAVKVTCVFKCKRCRLCSRFNYMMVTADISNCPTVRNNITVKAPILTQNLT